MAYVIGTGVSTANNSNAGATATSTASCTGGAKLIGGGYKITQSTGKGAAMESFPSVTVVNGTWTASLLQTINGNGSNQPSIQAYAICAS